MLDADLTLIVRHLTRERMGELRFQLESRDAWQGANRNEFGPLPFHWSEPQQFFEEHLKAVENLLEESGNDPQLAKRRLYNKGASLFVELLPDDLQQVLTRLESKVNTISIVSDEPWIPWELLRFPRPFAQDTTGGSFFGATFAIARWLRGIAPRRWLPAHHVALVTTARKELHTEIEAEMICSLATKNHRVTEVPPNTLDVMNALESGDFDAFHFAGHGWSSGHTPGGWCLELNRGQTIRVEDLQEASHGLARSRPLVFLNACQTGLADFSLTRQDGWAHRFLRSGAGAFVGAQWSIPAQEAVIFAKNFYREFFSGVPIAQSIRDARENLREKAPGDPTWLAYTVFAHPMASVMQGKPPNGLSTVADSESTLPKSLISSDDVLHCKTINLHHPAETASPTDPSRRRQWIREDNVAAQTSAASIPREASLTALFGWSVALLLLGPLMFVVSLVPTATRVRLDLKVKRIGFTLSAQNQIIVDRSLVLERLYLARFGRVELSPIEVVVLDQDGSRKPLTESMLPSASARHTVLSSPRLALTGGDPASEITLSSATAPPTSGILERIWASAASDVSLVVATLPGATELSMELTPANSLRVAWPHACRLQGRFIELQGMEIPETENRDVDLQVKLRPSHPFVEVWNSKRNLVLSAMLKTTPDQGWLPILERELAITRLELLRQTLDGQVQSALRSDTKLYYPNHAWLPPISLSGENFLTLDDLRGFRLHRIEISPNTDELRILGEGVAGKLLAGPSDELRDLRLRLHQQVFKGSRSAWLTSCLVVIIVASTSSYWIVRRRRLRKGHD